MKTGALILLSLVASATAFTSPMLATRAVGKPKIVAAKKAPTKEIPKKAPVKKFAAKKAVPAKSAPTKSVPAKSAPAKGGLFGKKAAPAKAAPAKSAPAKSAPAKGGLFAKKSAPAKVVAKKAPVKKVVAKKAPAKKVFAKKSSVKKVVKATPAAKGALRPKVQSSKAYITFDGASRFKIKGISGGGNKAPVQKILPPDLSDPKLQIYRDPKFYAEAAKKRLTKSKQELVFDDGLTIIERQQRKDIPTFLSGSARSQADVSTIVGEIEGVDYFGLSADRFQLLFITVFGLFFLIGFLSGRI